MMHRPLHATSAGRGRPTALVAVVLAVASAVSLAAGPTSAAPRFPARSGRTPTTPVADTARPGAAVDPAPVGDLPELAPEVADVAVSSREHSAAVGHREDTGRSLADAVRRKDTSGITLIELVRRDAVLTTKIADARSRVRLATARIDRTRRSIRDLAVANYISGRADTQDSTFDLDAERHNRLGSQEILVATVNRTQVVELHKVRAALAKARTEVELTTAVRDGVRRSIVDTTASRLRAVADEKALSVELVAAERLVEASRRLATVDGADFPLVVLDAYVKAAQTTVFTAPGCGIPWWALAGIGLTESQHGTFGGAAVRADGSLTRPIIGIPLTGAAGTASIGDSDGGVLDGDPTVDRAAGPMQFIPSTWVRWAHDGNGDGTLDIQNLYDAAASAAAYLCASGPMNNDDGLRRGYFSYNQSLPYVAQVLGQAHGYAGSVTLRP